MIELDKLDNNKGLLHAFDPYRSRPEDFMAFIKKYGRTNYRSTLWVDFHNFNYPYFLVFFVEKGTNGKIQAWGLCDRNMSKEISSRVKKKNDVGDPFIDIPYGFPGDKSYNFKRVFHYKKIGLFKKQHYCSELTLAKNRQPILDLRILRGALYVEIPPQIFNEIKEEL